MENNNQNELATYAAEIRSKAVERNGALADDLYADLIENMPNTPIPELVFETHFHEQLKNLAGGRRKDNTSIVTQWLGIAGSPYSGVDIVDAEGNVVMTTPGLYSRPVIDESVTKEYRLTNVAERYIQTAAVREVDANNYLMSKLMGIEKAAGSDIKPDLAKWEAVFEYFDKKKQPNSVDSNVDKSSDDDDDDKPRFGSTLGKDLGTGEDD